MKIWGFCSHADDLSACFNYGMNGSDSQIGLLFLINPSWIIYVIVIAKKEFPFALPGTVTVLARFAHCASGSCPGSLKLPVRSLRKIFMANAIGQPLDKFHLCLFYGINTGC